MVLIKKAGGLPRHLEVAKKPPKPLYHAPKSHASSYIGALRKLIRTYRVHELLLAVHIELRVNVLGQP